MEDNEVNVFRRIEWAVEAAKASTENREMLWRIEDVQWHSAGYAEPGYTDPEDAAIVCGNWNDISKFEEETRTHKTVDNTICRLARVLEKLGCELEWSDEWSECHDCCRLVRTSPDSYSWKPSYNIDEGSLLCLDCVDQEEYLSGIEGECRQINQMFDPAENGYVMVADEFENGFHRGQNADPQVIGDLMNEAGFERWLFHLEGKGQFDIEFSLWLHKEEAERCDGEGIILAKRVIEQGNTDGPDVAAAMERALKEASRQSDEMRKAGATGVIVSKVSMDGAETKEVSAQDFVDGKALD